MSQRTVLRMQLSLQVDEGKTEGKTEKKRRRDDKIQCTTESSFHGKHRYGEKSEARLCFYFSLNNLEVGKLKFLSGYA